MDYTDYHQIKEYCMEALEITEHFGIQEGLSFLIGEKFYHVHRKLRKAQSQARFAYDHAKNSESENDPLGLDGRSFKLNYALSLSENYQIRLARLRMLEKTQNKFVQEIKDSFESHDIQEFLNTYPSLGNKQKSPHLEHQSLDSALPMTSKEVFSEVEDILMVESMKKVFA